MRSRPASSTDGVALQWVVMKMLPFDNKSEFQVVLDMPEGTTVEHTARVLSDMAEYLRKVPELTDYQVYACTAAPTNFNRLVRQYYLREDANVGDLQVNLVDKALLRTRPTVIRAGAVRAKPIAVTALAAMLGAFFILDDPIFSGLAVSLIFGIFASTLLTLVLVPVLYYAFGRSARAVS